MKNNIKRLLILLTVLLTVNYSFSQNKELDKRNGFKTIKLGSHYDDFTGLKKINYKTNSYVWNPSNEELKYIFDKKIDFYTLTFSKKSKKLEQIEVSILIKKPYNHPDVYNVFKNIADKFILVLGNPNKVTKKSMSLGWFGENIILVLTIKSEQLEYDSESNLIALSSINIIFSLIDDDVSKDLKDGF